MFDLEAVLRPNLRSLRPYRCARDDYSSGILLDANENSLGPCLQSEQELRLHRYPDPHQTLLKSLFARLRNVRSENLFVGVGSDESIDICIRVFCVPGKHSICITPPTYGMYSVAAQINDVGVVAVPLDSEFALDFEPLKTTLQNNADIRVCFICSPGNPTGTLIPRDQIIALCSIEEYKGVIVVDEAYIDFSGGTSVDLLPRFKNLVILQTLSKSFGLAGIRIGVTIAHPDIIRVLNKVKAPYNVSSVASRIAVRALSDAGVCGMQRAVQALKIEQRVLADELVKIPAVGGILGGNHANFLLVRFTTAAGPCNTLAAGLYKTMADAGVVVRFRGDEKWCQGCLRITIGTREENAALLELLKKLC